MFCSVRCNILFGTIKSSTIFRKIVSPKQISYKSLIFTESAALHWANSVIEMPCQSVVLSVCLRHRMQFFVKPLSGPKITWSIPRPLIGPPYCVISATMDMASSKSDVNGPQKKIIFLAYCNEKGYKNTFKKDKLELQLFKNVFFATLNLIWL